MSGRALPPYEWLGMSSNRAPRVSNRPSWAVTCARCDNWWTGVRAAHCGACHRTFTGVRAFDIHRRGGNCLDPADIHTKAGEAALVPVHRAWSGWSEPGTWRGPDV